MWSNYKVVVATHQNTKHIHNHFIINSVSYITGKKYNNNHTNLAKLRQISDSLCIEYGLSVLEENVIYKNVYKHKVLNNDYFNIVKQDIDDVLSYSVTLKQFTDRLKQLGYKVYARNNILTVYKDGYDKVRTEKAFGNDYSLDKIKEKLLLSKQISFRPIPQKSIFEEYLFKTKNEHKGIYGLYLYYCYLLKVFPTKYPKQYLPYSIRQEIKKMEFYSEETRFMANNKIITLDDLKSFEDNNYKEYCALYSERENLWKKYHKAKDDNKKNDIIKRINEIKPEIEKLRKYKKYCDDIKIRSKNMEKNIKNFDNDLVKEKDNSRWS